MFFVVKQPNLLPTRTTQLYNGVFLRKPNKKELGAILLSYGLSDTNPYQYDHICVDGKGRDFDIRERINPIFGIISFPRFFKNEAILMNALLIFEIKIEIAAVFTKRYDGTGSPNKYTYNRGLWKNDYYSGFQPIEKIDYLDDSLNLVKLRAHVKSVLELNDQYGFVSKSLDDYRSIQRLGANDPMYFLALFSILENLLIDENTRSRDIKSALSKKSQFILQGKSPELLNLDFLNLRDLKYTTYLEKCYEYRNTITHGRAADFNGELRIFKNKIEQTVRHLDSVLRAILCFGIGYNKDLYYLRQV